MERPHQPLPVLGAWCCGVREPGSQGWRGWLGTATPGAARSLGPAPNQPHPEEERRRPGDLSGHLLAYLSLSPIFVIIGFVTLIIFKRELHTISFLGGLALNEGVNWLIKHVIQEPRPCGGPHAAVGTKYGMPSSHSQFMWFFSVYSFLFLYLRMHQTNNARFLDLLWRHLLSLGLLTAAFLVSYSRVYLLYHTWSQVLYGGVAGSLMAVAWFVFTQEVLTPLFPRIAAWPISEFFLIRDTSLIPNVLWFEYTVTRAEARNRQRKLGTKLQ
ncbi:dolichyldiphosphatase 1 isoform X1 [Oryctolagus cuniculus]|uniref:dolichyldiphosphatase 1 isoform X1 n=1 Tax=Oryctolagus cuniculus TaxID=9986 RepID=UPI0022317F37|nr:dolichyldiphosphatase 1 isoform X1 [Oryctolagus cuniculus]